ncbi:MAG: helix-turn-helix domain-containing protein [Paludibacteraceae bacterium]|nr:helix-turn-helix domain-containing protein [Paludibacteraceae bacterium]
MEITKEKYDYAQARIDALLPQITENTPADDPLMVELMIVTDVVEAYEKEHCHIKTPTLGEIIYDALETSGMSARQLADKINVSPSRISDYIHDRAEPTLKIARQLCQVLGIAPAEMLGING